MTFALLLANTVALPSNLLFWGGCALVAYLLFWNGSQSDSPRDASAPTLKLPFDPPQRLAPTTEALDHLHRVADHLEAKGLAAESIPHVDALAALLNRRG